MSPSHATACIVKVAYDQRHARLPFLPIFPHSMKYIRGKNSTYLDIHLFLVSQYLCVRVNECAKHDKYKRMYVCDKFRLTHTLIPLLALFFSSPLLTRRAWSSAVSGIVVTALLVGPVNPINAHSSRWYPKALV